MRKRVWEGEERASAKRSRSSLDGSIEEFVAIVGDADAKMRSVAISALASRDMDEELKVVREALEQRIGLETDESLTQQLVNALVSISTEKGSTGLILQQRYISDGCTDAVRICILSGLRRLCNGSLVLLKQAESIVLQDLQHGNPVLRACALKFFVAYYEKQHDDLVSDVLSIKFFDTHEMVRRTALDAAVSLKTVSYGLLKKLNAAALQLLRDSSESIRILAMQLLRRWASEVQAMREKELDLEKEMNYSFIQMCTMVTDACLRARKEACHVLGTMISASRKIMLHSLSKKSVLNKDDSATMCGRKAPFAMAAGAFVSAIEDEFPEVRSAAINALTNLSLHCTELLNSGALTLFLGMLNDQNFGVRKDTIQALQELVDKGVVSFEQQHLQMVSGALEDSDENVRKCGRSLLSSVKLPTVSLFKFVALALLNSLDHHPQDKEDVYKSLLCVGQGNASHIEALTDDFSSQMKILLNGEKGLEDPKLKALLNLCLAAKRSTGFPPWLPPEIICSAKLTEAALPLFDLSPSEAEDSARRIVQEVIRRALSAEQSAEGLTLLSACRKALSVLEATPLVNLASLYVECLTLVVQLSNSNSRASHHKYQRLATVLRSIQICFSGFTAIGELQLLELNVFFHLIHPDVNSGNFSGLSWILAESESLFPSTEERSSVLLTTVDEQLRNTLPKAERVKILTEAAKSFWPRHDILSTEIQEMRACLKVPASDFEHRLRFIAGFAYQMTVTSEVKNITPRSRIWIEMEFEDFPCQYRFLETNAEKMQEITDELCYYNMPALAMGVLRLRIVVELTRPELYSAVSRGPQDCVVPISSQQLVYLLQSDSG